jgi:mRNA interferase MazF
MTSLSLKRGDVVVVDFLPTRPAAQVRPALVVQNDRDNSRTDNTIVVQITTNLSRAGHDTQLLIDPHHPAWQASGLLRPSVVNGSCLAYVEQQDVLRVIGCLTDDAMLQVNECLRAALGLP